MYIYMYMCVYTYTHTHTHTQTHTRTHAHTHTHTHRQLVGRGLAGAVGAAARRGGVVSVAAVARCQSRRRRGWWRERCRWHAAVGRLLRARGVFVLYWLSWRYWCTKISCVLAVGRVLYEREVLFREDENKKITYKEAEATLLAQNICFTCFTGAGAL